MSARSPLLACAGTLVLCFGAIAQTTQARTATLKELVETKELSGVTVSPDGKWLVARLLEPSVDENSIKLSWCVARIPVTNVECRVSGGELPQVPTIQPTPNDEVQWSADSKWFYFRSRADGVVGIWRARPEAMQAEPIVVDQGDVTDFRLDSITGRIFFNAGLSTSERDRRVRESRAGGLLFDETMSGDLQLNSVSPFFMPSGPLRLGLLQVQGLAFPDGGEPHLKVYDLRSGRAWRATEQQAALLKPSLPSAFADSPYSGSWAFAPAGDKIAFLARSQPKPGSDAAEAGRSEEAPERLRLAWSSGGNGPVHLCDASICEGAASALQGVSAPSISWSADGKSIFLLRSADDGGEGSSTVVRWDIATGRARSVVSGSGLLTRNGRYYSPGICPISRAKMYCVEESSSSPPRLVEIDLSDGRRVVVFDPNAQLRQNDFTTATRVHWGDGSGSENWGWLYRPDASRYPYPRPLVITSYKCGGFNRGSISSQASEQILVDAGYVVLCSQVRGKQSHRGHYLAWTRIVDQLAASGMIDPRKVGVSGWSYTSAAAGYAMVQSPGKFAAYSIQIIGAQTDPWRAYYMTPGELKSISTHQRMDYRKVFGNTPNYEDFLDKSVTLNASKIQDPILVQGPYSEYIYNVPAVLALRRNNKPVEYVIFPDEGHAFMQPIHQMKAMQRSFDWFDYWLSDRQHPASDDQYERWDKLRELHDRVQDGSRTSRR